MATVSLTIPDAQVGRVLTAFGLSLGLTDAQGQNRDATAQEVKAWIIDRLKAIVLAQERQVEERKIAVADVTVT